jgi:triosephosphate isomerase (TIM)
MARLRPLVAGNWKMNGTVASLAEIEAVKAGIAGVASDVAICPPATLIAAAARVADGSPLLIGGQDCDPASSGAHTGDISAEMIKDSGGKLIIVGHSERRVDHGEDDALVRAKAEAVWRAGLLAILCIGETRAEREAGRTLAILERQLAGSVPDKATGTNLVVAYEPVWAIGTGLTPSNDDIRAAHAHIRSRLKDRFGGEGAGIRILYGGSVKPQNAKEILALADVDGALVGGASLKAADFLGIIAAYR